MNLPQKYYSLDLDLYLEDMPDTEDEIYFLFEPLIRLKSSETVAVVAFDNPYTYKTYRLCLDMWGLNGHCYQDWAIYTEQFHEQCLPLKCFGPATRDSIKYWRELCLTP
jgi:hypothetical protein